MAASPYGLLGLFNKGGGEEARNKGGEEAAGGRRTMSVPKVSGGERREREREVALT